MNIGAALLEFVAESPARALFRGPGWGSGTLLLGGTVATGSAEVTLPRGDSGTPARDVDRGNGDGTVRIGSAFGSWSGDTGDGSGAPLPPEASELARVDRVAEWDASGALVRVEGPEEWVRAIRALPALPALGPSDPHSSPVPVPAPATPATHGADDARRAEQSTPVLAAHAPAPPPSSRRYAPGRLDEAGYRAAVCDAQEVIRRGDAYVLCLTTTVLVEHPRPPRLTFDALCAAGPARFAAILEFPSHTLVSASPELFLDITPTRVRTSPIKGTRARGQSPAEDDAQAELLRTDPKERAENVMILDLLRNDIGRIGEPGSLRVEGLLTVERHAVHQLVSTVSVRPRAEIGVAEVLDSCFPGGSMTGAPRQSAITELRRMERAPRGRYAGCFGIVVDARRATLAMTIRTLDYHDGIAEIGCGGGITADSDPDRELAEMRLKADALLRAAGPSLPAAPGQ